MVSHGLVKVGKPMNTWTTAFRRLGIDPPAAVCDLAAFPIRIWSAESIYLSLCRANPCGIATPDLVCRNQRVLELKLFRLS
jgi:hypothetical protein